jgi:hypothetical protein
VPSRMDRRSVAVFSHAAEVRPGATWAQPGESRCLFVKNSARAIRLGVFDSGGNADPLPAMTYPCQTFPIYRPDWTPWMM